MVTIVECIIDVFKALLKTYLFTLAYEYEGLAPGLCDRNINVLLCMLYEVPVILIFFLIFNLHFILFMYSVFE